jgi:cell division protease FtsH
MTPKHNDADFPDSALKPLALLAAGLTGADIERVVRELRGNCRRQDIPLTWTALEEALMSGRNPPSAKLALPIAVHELGHAIAYECLGIATVEIVRVGGDRGGETHSRLHVDAIQDEAGMLKWMACLLAGRTAEMLVLGTAMLGSGGRDESDLARATTLALNLETAVGMGDDMPLLYRLPANPAEAMLYNPRLAERVHRRLKTAEAIARDVLSQHQLLLTRLAGQLAEAMVLDGDDLRREVSTFDLAN